jgi:NAD(P)-dependent dehydrogenase (short-subunit alcohol dehydrogenase family)
MSEAAPATRAIPAALSRFDLTGRVAVVTGASSGLGAGIARALASVGGRVAVVARERDPLAQLAADIGGLALGCDLLDEEQAGQLVPRVAAELGCPQILVNAAGRLFSSEPAEHEPPAAIRQTLELNLVAPFRLSQAMFPHMVEAGRGSIVNVLPISGPPGGSGSSQASYAASKLGLSGLTAELAVQWARHAIRVNTVAPGFLPSETTDAELPADVTVDDFIGAVLWLASDAGQYVTGQTIVVDGGWTAP